MSKSPDLKRSIFRILALTVLIVFAGLGNIVFTRYSEIADFNAAEARQVVGDPSSSNDTFVSQFGHVLKSLYTDVKNLFEVSHSSSNAKSSAHRLEQKLGVGSELEPPYGAQGNRFRCNRYLASCYQG